MKKASDKTSIQSLDEYRERSRQLLDSEAWPPAPVHEAQIEVEILMCHGQRTHKWNWPGKPEFRERLRDEVFPRLLLLAAQADHKDRQRPSDDELNEIGEGIGRTLFSFFNSVSRRPAEIKHWLNTKDTVFRPRDAKRAAIKRRAERRKALSEWRSAGGTK